MNAAVPFWRRMRTDGAAARLTALMTIIIVIALIGLLIALPLMERLEDAKRKAAR